MPRIGFTGARACVAAAGVVVLASTACSSSTKATGSSSTVSAAATGGSTVHIKNFSFEPSALTVAVGTKVTWIFDDSAKHNVTAANKSFGSKDLSSGQSFSFSFATPGTYNYICTIHQYMTAKVIVVK